MTITRAVGREILDSRGRPTVEAELELDDGRIVAASVPSGASTGSHEAVERRDGDPARYRGLGVRDAAAAIGAEIDPVLRGLPAIGAVIDRVLLELDGTPGKSRLGANAVLAVSLAAARAEALVAGVPLWRHLAGPEPLLPLPMVNMISGGLHAGRQLDFQDFLVMPVGAESYRQALEWTGDVHAALAEELAARGHSLLKADEGGFGPALGSNREALDVLDAAVERAGRALGSEIAYAVDVASTHFHDPAGGTYRLRSEDRELSASGMVRLLERMVAEHPVISIEDGLAEDDWEHWPELVARLGDRVQIVGDDLFVTHPARVRRGVETGAANAVLVKMNQIGTITETAEVVELARAHRFATVISARSGETEDPALADLAVGWRGGQIKIGSITQSERLAKYNQLLRIEEALGDAAVFAGPSALGRTS
ncbi:phosphopyruvate hydratase [Leucobacter allii]|uniref:phosphopyruvate hydratase n=1 Tax=Leucobacter allii TaxID=2932247 RepID=UPI003D2E42A7